MLRSISLNFSVFLVDKDHGGVRNDTKLMLSDWNLGLEDNLNFQWKIAPWCKSPNSTHLACLEKCKSPYKKSTFPKLLNCHGFFSKS